MEMFRIPLQEFFPQIKTHLYGDELPVLVQAAEQFAPDLYRRGPIMGNIVMGSWKGQGDLPYHFKIRYIKGEFHFPVNCRQPGCSPTNNCRQSRGTPPFCPGPLLC